MVPIPLFSRNAFSRRFLAMFAACGVLVIASCGESSDFGLGERFPVSGNVTYNGKPLEKGQINFFPDDPKGVGATGSIENGSYAMSTVGDKDGARVGKYKVTIVSKEDSEAQAKAAFEKAKAKFTNISKNMEGTTRIPNQYMVKAELQAKSLIPAGYGHVATTTLTADVKGSANTIDFTLSDASAPPEPPAVGKGRGRKDR